MWDDPTATNDTSRRLRLRGMLRPGVIAVGAISVVLWIVRLGLALYALLLFDIALPSYSVATIVGLFALAVALIVSDMLLAGLRRRTLRQVAAALDHQFTPIVADRQSMRDRAEPISPVADDIVALDRLRAALGGSTAPALIDIIAVPIFIGLLFGLGWPMALAMMLSVGTIWLTLFIGRKHVIEARTAADAARADRDRLRMASDSDRMVLATQGMTARIAATQIWADRQAAEAESAIQASSHRVSTAVATIIAITIVLVASVSAWRIILDLAGAGTLAAIVVLALFILAPLWTLSRNLAEISGLRPARDHLRKLLGNSAPATPPVALPKPKSNLSVENLGIPVPGQRRVLLQQVACTAAAGDVIALVGPGGVGKTILLATLSGVLKPAAGQIRLDGSTLDQWAPEELARHIGYLPQTIDLIDGSVSQNIARFDPAATSHDIIHAAKMAGVHDMIVRLPQGYDTPVGPAGTLLSASERQRIGIARAFFGDPFLILLDDPGAFLDPQSSNLLSRAIRTASERGAIVIGSGNSAAVIDEARLLMVLRAGGMLDFGPSADVRERMVKRRQGRINDKQPQADPQPERPTE